MCGKKLTVCQLKLLHRTNQQKKYSKELKTKNRVAEKKQSGQQVCGVSIGREFTVGKICERGRF